MTGNGQLLKKVAEVYGWLDLQTSRYADTGQDCDACGQCCDFTRYDHRLFVTTPELMYLTANLDGKKQKPMTTSRCPYQSDGKCTVYEYRFAGCRIFNCKAEANFQSTLSESALERFKALCTEYQIPYRYTDLAAALNSPAG